MSLLEGRVAIVTGAGRGIGRAHALELAVARRGGRGQRLRRLALAGEGTGESPADEVVAAIEAAGGRAVANGADVADFEQAAAMVQQAIDTFGGLDILVNNAGFVRDRMLVNTSEEEWDAVIRVHLKGHFAPLRHAGAYWRAEAKEGRQRAARVINTSAPAPGCRARSARRRTPPPRPGSPGSPWSPPRSWGGTASRSTRSRRWRRPG